MRYSLTPAPTLFAFDRLPCAIRVTAVAASWGSVRSRRSKRSTASLRSNRLGFSGLGRELARFDNSQNVKTTTVRLPKDLAGLGEGLLVLYGDFGIGFAFGIGRDCCLSNSTCSSMPHLA